MPYIIYTTESTIPYVLADEDEPYLKDFNLIGWRYEHRHSTDVDLLQSIKEGGNLTRAALFTAWEKQSGRCFPTDEDRDSKKAKKKKKKQSEHRGKNDMGKVASGGLRTKISNLFGKKGSEAERPGYKNGVYVNYLEGLQRKWSEPGYDD
jgi:hypothetical protein